MTIVKINDNTRKKAGMLILENTMQGSRLYVVQKDGINEDVVADFDECYHFGKLTEEELDMVKYDFSEEEYPLSEDEDMKAIITEKELLTPEMEKQFNDAANAQLIKEVINQLKQQHMRLPKTIYVC